MLSSSARHCSDHCHIHFCAEWHVTERVCRFCSTVLFASFRRHSATQAGDSCFRRAPAEFIAVDHTPTCFLFFFHSLVVAATLAKKFATSCWARCRRSWVHPNGTSVFACMARLASTHMFNCSRVLHSPHALQLVQEMSIGRIQGGDEEMGTLAPNYPQPSAPSLSVIEGVT
jgi:hypothetical protein